jgi:hypothetical protein
VIVSAGIGDPSISLAGGHTKSVALLDDHRRLGLRVRRRRNHAACQGTQRPANGPDDEANDSKDIQLIRNLRERQKVVEYAKCDERYTKDDERNARGTHLRFSPFPPATRHLSRASGQSKMVDDLLNRV